MRTKAQFDRQPGSVIVKVKPPAAHVAKTESAYQDWQPIASQIISDVQAETPAPAPAKQSLQSLLSEVDAIMQKAVK